jgi:soluble lytic murein transglycosylase
VRALTRVVLVLILAATAVIAVVSVMSWRGEMPRGLAARVYPLAYEAEIAAAAERHGLDPYLVAAVVRAESNFEPEAVSRAGAVGLMQVMPATAGWITERPDWQGGDAPRLTDPRDNTELGSYYLAYLVDRFDDVPTALAAYNAGHGEVDRWLRNAGEEGSSTVTVAEIPFRETRDFVQRVERFREILRSAHPKAF